MSTIYTVAAETRLPVDVAGWLSFAGFLSPEVFSDGVAGRLAE